MPHTSTSVFPYRLVNEMILLFKIMHQTGIEFRDQ